MKDFMIKKDEQLTEKVKRFFGEGIVENVYQVEVLNEDENCEDHDHRDFLLKHLDRKIENFSNINDVVMLQNESIIVDFSSGKSVMFSSGFFGSYDHNEMTKVNI